MKITAFILLVLGLHVNAAGYGQGITLSEKNAPIEQVFKEIRKQTGYLFFYSDAVLEGAKGVTINVKGGRIEDVLKVVFEGQPLEYMVKDRTVVVRRKSKTGKSVTDIELPPVDLRGTVADSKGTALPGANIKVKGTSIGTVTDGNGGFTLNNIDSSAVIEVSFVGYDMQLIPLRGRTFLAINLNAKNAVLEETVVIAYGTTTKKLNTGNIGTIKSEDLERQPVTNPLLAMQGRIAGLNIVQSNGIPGGGVTVRVQGTNSISNGNDPFYVIDGVPYESQMLPTITGGYILGGSGSAASTGGSPLSYINPNDIERIEVLKDADATAIYGSRAANGAILITTKKGKIGKTRIDLNFQRGVGKITNKADLLHTQQYLAMRREALMNDGLTTPASTDYDINGFWDSTAYTDWQDELLGGSAQYTNAHASIAGGTANTQFLVGATFNHAGSVFPGNFSDDKGGLHFNISNTSANDKFKMQLSGNYVIDVNKLPYVDLTSTALSLPPNAPKLYTPEGDINWAPDSAGNNTWPGGLGNPIAYYINSKYQIKTTNLISSLKLNYRLFPFLNVSTNIGYTELNSNERNIFPLTAVAPEQRPTASRYANYNNSSVKSWIVEPQLEAKQTFGKLRLNLLAGSTFQQTNKDGNRMLGFGYNSDAVLESIKSAASVFVTSAINSMYRYSALFSRFTANFDDKYIVNLSARRDGSSRFGSQNRFHSFGAIGTAWIFSNENLLKETSSILSFGKLRGSYGTSGNDQIGDYQFMNLYAPPDLAQQAYQGVSSLEPKGLPNPYLQWEETKKLQMGLDLGFFHDRVLLTANYYRNKSSNQLLTYQLPVLTGFGAILTNFPATINNHGWEFTASTSNIDNKDFKWNTNFTLTIERNKLKEFPDLSNSSYSDFLVVGQPLTVQRVFKYLGVDPTTGIYEFADANGNPTSTPSYITDRAYWVNTNPKFYGGIQNDLTYKSFSLSFFFQFVKKIGPAFNFGNTFYAPGYFATNQPVDVLNRWQKPGDPASVQKFSSDFSIYDQFSFANASDGAYADASFIRLKNVSLSYQVNKAAISKIHLEDLRLFCQAQNLLTITSFKGQDPESSIGTLPPLRMLIAGVQISL